ncbi:hypothetical protein QA584_01965 [Anaerocolumna sp. AGMB13025]|uniref:hypothetical protein n=1 Tax=Anaerocolumna sp. AGMB13025 TaxID=3039116 RepID=UPI00241C42CE|nr:hypothetical protein [Anaerocolumna sp. AGMB13025]WFR57870.1 hypothetical protein QA584_01965 [Anaerocolumna sp. AGMB13025]
MSKRIMLPFITMLALVLILCTEAAAGSLNTKEEGSIPVVSGNLSLSKDRELNEAEKVILNLLNINGNTQNETGLAGDYNIYTKSLYDHLEKQGVALTTSKAYEALNKIMELKAIINIEQESDFNKMSVDGRELAINLSKEIYNICGLSLTCDIGGNITRITDKAGNYLYLNTTTVETAQIHFKALFITLAVIMILLVLCIIIARKNQLFIKDVRYDGFKEEGFVQ